MKDVDVLYNTIKEIAYGAILDYKPIKLVYGTIIEEGTNKGYKVEIEKNIYDDTTSTGTITPGMTIPILLIDGNINKRLIIAPLPIFVNDTINLTTKILETKNNVRIIGNYKAGDGINITKNIISASPSYDFVSASDSLDDIIKPGVYFVSATEENNRGINGASEPFMMLVNNKDDEVNLYAHIGANIYHRKILGEWEVKS